MIEPYWQEEGITIYHGDCRDVIAQIPERSVDLLITDPPYASGARRDAERQVRGSMLRSMEDADWFSHDAMTTWGFNWFLRSILGPLQQVMAIGSHLYWFTDWRMTPIVYGMLEAHSYRVNHCLVWAKTHFGMGAYWRNQHENIVFASVGKPADMLNKGMGSVLHFSAVSSSSRQHPTEKPVGLLQSIMASVPGQVVLDPFMGSGSTLLAAKELGRQAIGIEIDEEACDLAIKRLRQQVLPLEYV